MKRLLSILIPFLLISVPVSGADEVDPVYFHPAAGHYIQGDLTTASNLVTEGLARFPDDPKLTRLKELIEQQQEEQQENQQNQDNSQENEQQDQQEDQEEQENENQNDAQPESGDDSESTPQPQPSEPEQMSEEEAKQLLDAMRQEEQNKRLQLHPVMGPPVKVDKDW